MRLRDSMRTASKLGNGLVLVIEGDGTEPRHSERLAGVECGASLPEFEPWSCSFNSRFGACEGLGLASDLDPRKPIFHPQKLLASAGWPRGRVYRDASRDAIWMA